MSRSVGIVRWLLTWSTWYFVILPEAFTEKVTVIEGPLFKNWFDVVRSRRISGQGEHWGERNGGLYTCTPGGEADFWITTYRVELNTTNAKKIYTDVEVELTMCDNSKPCFVNSFEIYIHRHENVTDQLKIPEISDNVDLIQNIFAKEFSLLYSISNQTSSSAALLTRSIQTFSFPRNNSHAVTFAVRSRGACGTIFRMKMYYYVCEETILNGIELKRTLSPAEGFTNVSANCSENSVPVTNRVRVFNGYCYANGTWTLPEDQNLTCLCIEGYAVNRTDGSCTRCSWASYKTNVSKENCTGCPANSISNMIRTGCVCKDGYNRVNSSNKTELPCYITSKNNPETTRPSTSTKDDDYSMIYIIIGVLTGVLLIVISLLVIFIRKRRRRSELKKTPNNGHEYFNEEVELPLVGRRLYVDATNYDDPGAALKEFACELSPDMIFFERMIGEGEFGDVYKGQLTTTDGKKIPVAAKTLKHDTDTKGERDFMLEASVMGQFDNANVVKMIGVVTTSTPRMIVLEFMSNGSLDKYLKCNHHMLSNLQLMNMALGVSSGMKYLAKIHFVHRDLAAGNVLVSDELICKIANFGLSRELFDKRTSTAEYVTRGGKIPVRWTAPEAINYRKFSSASDVWSFGILLWEIMSFGERPYWDWDNFKVIQKLEEGFRLPPPQNCPKAVHALMLRCWEADKSERPKFLRITTVIDKWIRSPETMNNDLDLSSSIGKWLLSIKMSSYEETFVDAGYRSKADVIDLTDEDLITIGVVFIEHRNKIMKGINCLKDERNRQSMPI